ncbi:hypothetical protein Lal_00042242 [Lupinus albus]|nr:hypothetical protein Lal_00042242 [Lupinus albus]
MSDRKPPELDKRANGAVPIGWEAKKERKHASGCLSHVAIQEVGISAVGSRATRSSYPAISDIYQAIGMQKYLPTRISTSTLNSASTLFGLGSNIRKKKKSDTRSRGGDRLAIIGVRFRLWRSLSSNLSFQWSRRKHSLTASTNLNEASRCSALCLYGSRLASSTYSAPWGAENAFMDWGEKKDKPPPDVLMGSVRNRVTKSHDQNERQLTRTSKAMLAYNLYNTLEGYGPVSLIKKCTTSTDWTTRWKIIG